MPLHQGAGIASNDLPVNDGCDGGMWMGVWLWGQKGGGGLKIENLTHKSFGIASVPARVMTNPALLNTRHGTSLLSSTWAHST